MLNVNFLLDNYSSLIKKTNLSDISCEKNTLDFIVLSPNVELEKIKNITTTLILIENIPQNSQLKYLKNNSPHLIILSSKIEAEKYFSGLPFIQLENTDLTPIINDIIRLYNVNSNSKRELVYNDYPQLVRLVAKDKSLEKILDFAAEILNNPLIMTDKGYELLAYSNKQKISDPIWQDIVKNDYCSYDIIQMMKKEGFLDKLDREKSPVFLEEGEFSNFIRRLVCEVTLNDEVQGFIALLEYNKKITSLDREIMKFVSLLVAAKLSRTDAITKAKGKLKDNFIRDLIEGNLKRCESAINRAKALDWKMKDIFQIISVRKKNNKRFTGQHLHSIQSIFKKNFPNVQTSSSPNEIIVLLIEDDEQMGLKNFKNLKNYCKKYNLYVGIGKAKRKIVEVDKSYNEAKKALYINRKTNRDNIINFFRNLNIYDIVDDIGKEKYLPSLEKIIEYDENNNGRLIKTLKTYYAEGQNMNKASEKLFIHRNTVKYRLQKISKMLNLNLNEYQNRLQIELSLLRLEIKKN